MGYVYGGFRGSAGMGILGIPTGFSVGMRWVWGLKFSSHGSSAAYTILLPL